MKQANNSYPSEQLPNDGGYHLPRLVKEAKARLKKIGKHGKRAMIKGEVKYSKPIIAQFKHPINGQTNMGLSLELNPSNLIKAEEICTLITAQLMAGTFTDEWLYKLIGKENKLQQSDRTLELSCKEMLEQYKVHFFKQKKNLKNPNNTWYTHCRYIESVLAQCDKPINLKIVREIVESTENNSHNRIRVLNGLTDLLKHFDNTEFKAIIKKYKSENNPKRKKKHIPDDGEIMNVYNYGFQIHPKCSKGKRYRYAQWQFLYSLLATYGLRVHEAWNIKNWNKPVTLSDGDWIAVTDNPDSIDNKDNEGKYLWQRYQGSNLTIPAILDPNNDKYLLSIGHQTKTGYRIAFPLSPNGHDWIKEFNIVQPFNLPDIPDPLEYWGNNKQNCLKCSNQASNWFQNHKYGFTSHALRHAYNIRGHKLGVNQKVLCDSLGHGLQMNSSTYLRHEGDLSKLEGILQEISKDKIKRSRIEELEKEVLQLRSENERLRTELMLLKTLKNK